MRIRCPECGEVVVALDEAKSAKGKCPHCGATFDVAAAERVGLSPGDTLDDYRIDGLIGRGGMATVYRGTQLSLDRPVAIKVLAAGLAQRRPFVERFRREALLLAQLSHPHIVRILSVGSDEGLPYLVMEYVDGESLRARLVREGRLPLHAALELIDQVAAGLAYAHEHGVLHRDIKPGNVLLMADGHAKIADFGIARLMDPGGALGGQLTLDSAPMGSAHYMAPEQMKDAAHVDARSDVYALGVLLYELLTGELPIGQFKPASKLAPGVPTALDRVVRTALAASPDERFDSMADFRAALDRAVVIAAPTRIRAARRHPRAAPPSTLSLVPIVAAVAAVLAVGLAIAYLTTRKPAATPPPRAVAPPATPASPEPRPPAPTTATPPKPKPPKPKPRPRPKPKPPAPRPEPTHPPPQPKPVKRPELPPGPTPEPYTLVVTTRIDGVSDLVLTPGALHWEHRKHHRPGTARGHRIASIPTVLNGRPWFPDWVGNRSDPIRSRRLPKSFAGWKCEVSKLSGRGSVSLVHAGDRKIVVRFSDDKAGSDDYQARIYLAPGAAGPR